MDIATKNTLTNIINQKKWRETNIKKMPQTKLFYLINDGVNNGLCIYERKTAIPQNSLDIGKTPYVTTSSYNNGISGYYDEDANTEGKCLSVALNGSVGEVFFQYDDFITSSDNVILRLKDGYNPYLLFYISILIKNNQWKYNYYRKMTLTDLKNMQILLPITTTEKIDFNFIKKVVKNSYGFSELYEHIK